MIEVGISRLCREMRFDQKNRKAHADSFWVVKLCCVLLCFITKIRSYQSEINRHRTQIPSSRETRVTLGSIHEMIQNFALLWLHLYVMYLFISIWNGYSNWSCLHPTTEALHALLFCPNPAPPPVSPFPFGDTYAGGLSMLWTIKFYFSA